MTTRPTLYTDRLCLRPVEARDEELMIALGSNPDVMRYIHAPQSPDDIRAIMPLLINRRQDSGLGYWVVERREDGVGIGQANLNLMPLNGPDLVAGLKPGDIIYSEDVEIGYLFLPDAWGKGYATEAASCLLTHAFQGISLPKVVAVTDAENTASQKVLKKIGMRPIGNLYAYGSNGPGFELLKNDWENNRLSVDTI